MTSLLRTLHQWIGLPISLPSSASTNPQTIPPGPERVGSFLQQVLDDDRLNDACWNAEMRTVEVWENERWAGAPAPSSPTAPSGDAFEAPNHQTTSRAGGWGKANLKPDERGAWTRGRDGWSAVGVATGEVSNLTFALGPGWEFVPTEGWRRDVRGVWSACGADREGWIYTNDAWMDARAAPAGRGAATRRRRWVRRVWFRGEDAPDTKS